MVSCIPGYVLQPRESSSYYLLYPVLFTFQTDLVLLLYSLVNAHALVTPGFGGSYGLFIIVVRVIITISPCNLYLIRKLENRITYFLRVQDFMLLIQWDS